MTSPAAAVCDLFPGEGELAALMRAHDWAATPLGPVDQWSQSLRTMVSILLANRFPLLLWWGPDQHQLYNDAYRPVLGVKHPRSLGQPARECWPEIWSIIGPLIRTPYEGGPSTWDDDLSLEVNRHGFVEETHFTVAYSPVPDESVPGGIGGVLATVHEITSQVLQERRLAVLRDLGARASEAKTAEEACAIAADALSHHPKDVPFALLYLLDADQQTARLAGLAGIAGVPGDGDAAPHTIDLTEAVEQCFPWPIMTALRTGTPQLVENLPRRLPHVPPGPWSDPPTSALVFPIRSTIQHRWAGVLVLGISARLALDDFYRSFCELVTAQVATAIANARAYEDERRRAEALAELDRAKTAFFSNVSHEFRTPLTLLLGPLADVLGRETEALPPAVRQELQVAQRNGQRLLKLVNTLLDFSRIEAGRMEASYTPTDLAAVTAELASVFRSAIESAGLRFSVDCPPLPESIYVDPEMWEKVVLNLLSNAFKFTLDGEISVALRWARDCAVLTVRDTGVGIPAEALPHLFERFHRVRGTQARSQEGTGIGLALVQELVHLHGGRIAVESVVGHGTAFNVTIPAGSAHLPADQIGAGRTLASTAVGASAYVEEALRWLPGAPAIDTERAPLDGTGAGAPTLLGSRTARVLLADDNTDMREYLARLLGQYWTVEAVAEGTAALAAARALQPDLVVSDVMMPGLDGFA
ncbi:MAG TPA: ATP-binding protein, partial [Dehalococcoidia bacterium]